MEASPHNLPWGYEVCLLECKGPYDDDTLAIPYAKWLLVQNHHPFFLFLFEMNCMVSDASSVLKYLNPTFVHGVDAFGSRGGLLLLGWSSNHVVVNQSSKFLS